MKAKQFVFLTVFMVSLAFCPAMARAGIVEKTATVHDIRSYGTNQNVLCFMNTGSTVPACFLLPTATQNVMMASALTAISASLQVKYAYDSSTPTLLNRIFVSKSSQ